MSGVTLHEMRPRADEGTVIRTSPFRITTDDPAKLRDQANERVISMMLSHGPSLLAGTYQYPPLAEEWCGCKRSRKDTIKEALTSRHPAFEGFY